jgi:hypothetical protein
MVTKALTWLMAAAILMGCSQPSDTSGEAPVEESGAAASQVETAAMTEEGAAPTGEDAAAGPPKLVDFAGIHAERGLISHDPERTSPGYILYSPMISSQTFLIDRDGQVVKVWQSDFGAGSDYLLDDGHLLRAARQPDAPRFNGGGQSGRIEKFDWEGNLVWTYTLADENYLLHHDIEPMPNGNILSIAWEAIGYEDALAAGRAPDKLPKAGLWPDLIVEIALDEDGGEVVWRWRAWDHLVQNTDPELPDYGDPSDHPGRVDVNTGEAPWEITPEELAEGKANNEIPGTATMDDRGSDFQHSNAITYNAELDQIAMSVRALSEIWVIDHGLTEEEAAGPAGDILYRWGNPKVYGRPTLEVGLGHQHDIRWIPDGYPGAGNLMAFSNDAHGAERPHSQVVEFTPPLTADGHYRLEEGRPYGPETLAWSYQDPNAYAPFISGANRLPDGNTLVNYGPQGRFVEVTPEGDVVWEFWSPYTGDVRMPDGSWPQPGAPFFYSVFRATFIPADHPALAGRELQPLDPQPALIPIQEDELAPFLDRTMGPRE